jgi:demethylmenaquinone methyltransferase/2-methoxy-6-polyprenyl-1,4-benzoquinol methylase
MSDSNTPSPATPNQPVQNSQGQNLQSQKSEDGHQATTSPNSPFLSQPLPQGTPQGQQQSLPKGADHSNLGSTTHFGYKTVDVEEKQQKVAEVFHSVAAKYDLMNDLMSFGIHRLWKRFAINLSGVRRGQQVLDIAGGTGDLALAFSREVGPQGHVVLSDINESMLNVGRDRLIDKAAPMLTLYWPMLKRWSLLATKALIWSPSVLACVT